MLLFVTPLFLDTAFFLSGEDNHEVSPILNRSAREVPQINLQGSIIAK